MEKKYWLLNLAGVGGYSVMIHCEAKDENEALEVAAMNHVFDDDRDIFFASCEEADEDSVKHFVEHNLVVEL